MNESKKFAFDVGITFIASVLNTIIGFIVTILLGRFVGVNDLGLYRMISTIFLLIMLFSTIGIPSAIIKYSAEYKNESEKLDQIASSGILTSFLIGICLTTVIIISAKGFESLFKMPNLANLILLLAPVFPFALTDSTLLGFLNGLRKMKKFTAGSMFKSVLMLFTTFILIFNGFGASGAVIGLIISFIGSSLFLIIISKKHFRFTLTAYYSTTKTLLRFGIQIVVAQIINETTNQLDIILIGLYLSSVELGYYAASISLSKFLWLIPLSIQKITYPTTTEYWIKEDHKNLSKILDKSIKYSTICLVILGLTIGFGAKEIIFLVFDEGFDYSIIPLQILLFGAVIRGSITQPIGGSLTGIGRPDLVLKTTLIMAFSNLSLGVLLIPRYGIIGAAIATSLALIIGSLLYLFLVIRYLSFDFDYLWFLKIGGIAVLALILQIISFILINNPLISGSIVVFLTIFMIYTLQLTPNDKKFFISLIHSLFDRRR